MHIFVECVFCLCAACVKEPQFLSIEIQGGAPWPSVCAPSPTKHGKLTSPLSKCETLYPIPACPLHSERTGDNSLKGQEIAP